MFIQAPVYHNENDTHYINIYEETEDGTFRRTQNEPLRQLRNNIKGISLSQGELVSPVYDRQERKWSTATVSFHYGRPQSFYYFLRDMLARNKFYVFSKPQLSGHLIKFEAHELILKPGTSQRHLSLLKEKYVESIDLWDEQTLHAKRAKLPAAKLAKISGTKPVESLDVDFESAKTLVILPHQRQAAGLAPAADAAEDQDSSSVTHSVDTATASEKRTLNNNAISKPGFLKRFIFTID